MAPRLDIIVVNWNSGNGLSQCLESIVAADKHGILLSRVVVVDNASSDESLKAVASVRLPMLQSIRNDRNRGFAAACNQGAAGSEADYLLFLNPDVRLLANSLAHPVAFMERPENSSVGIVGIQLLHDDGRIARSCARFPTPWHFLSKTIGVHLLMPRIYPPHPMTDWDHRDSREVDHVMGAFFLVRRSLFQLLGGFDEQFFVYLEDLDFSLRARRAGWRSVYLAQAQAFHKGGGSSNQTKAARLFYSLRSRILYGFKHFGFFGGASLTLGTLLIEPVSRLVLALAHRSPREAWWTATAYVSLWSWAASLLASQPEVRRR